MADQVANGINVAGSGWGASLLGLSVVALAIAFRRWRHLAVFVGGLLFLDYVGTQSYYGLSQPRPYGVPVITGWAGYAGASPPVAVLAFCSPGAVYCLAVPGRARSRTGRARRLPPCTPDPTSPQDTGYTSVPPLFQLIS